MVFIKVTEIEDEWPDVTPPPGDEDSSGNSIKYSIYCL